MAARRGARGWSRGHLVGVRAGRRASDVAMLISSLIATAAVSFDVTMLWLARSLVRRDPRLDAFRSTVAAERRLLAMLRPHTGQVASGIAIAVVSTLIGLAQPWPTKILIDDVLGDQRILGLAPSSA